jgi:hydrogenase nickel incorporation protein HypA/HybF
MQYAFDAIKPGTIFDSVILDIDRIPFSAKCTDCETKFSMKDEFLLMCPSCGSRSAQIISGKELYIESIEAEEEGD